MLKKTTKIFYVISSFLAMVNSCVFAQSLESSLEQKPEDNAAVYYEKAFSLLKEYSREEIREFNAVIENGWKGENNKLDNVLRENEQALKEIENGLRLEKCYFTYNKTYRYLSQKPLPNMWKIHLIARLFILKGRMLERDNNFKQAMEEYLSLLKFSRHISQGGSLVETMMSVAMANMAHKVLSQYLVRIDAHQEITQKIQAFLKMQELNASQIVAVAECEKKSWLSAMQELVDRLMKEIEANKRKTIFPWIQRQGKDFYASLVPYAEVLGDKYYGKLIKAAQTNMLADRQEYEKEVARLNKEIEFSVTHVIKAMLRINIKEYTVKLSLSLMLSDAKFLDNFYFSMTQFRILQTVAAIKMYYFEKTFMPETLNNLVPEFFVELPKDPYSQQALKFEKTGKGFVIYSIGKDRQDNSGKGSFDKDSAGQDIILNFEAPEAER